MSSHVRFLTVIPAAAALAVGGFLAATASASTTASAGTGAVAGAKTISPAHGLPDFGNTGGHASVPRAGTAVNTSHPDHVIGTGTPAGCTSAAVVKAVGPAAGHRRQPRSVTAVNGRRPRSACSSTRR